MDTDLSNEVVAALRDEACRLVDSRADVLLKLSHDVHATPELAFEEYESSRAIAVMAQEEGLQVQSDVFGLETALMAEFGGAGPTVGILSEYDALPGIGHACGHNIIASAGVGAAIALNGLGEKFPGKIRWLGTPAEERGCGKELMAQKGAFDGVDAAMMVHPAGVDARAIRTLCISDAEVIFTGRPAHAAVNPHAGLNALDAAVLAYQAIGLLRQHFPYGDLINAVISTPTSVPNVIPGVAKIEVFLRAPTAARLKALRARFDSAMKAGAMGTGCDVTLNWSNADYLDYKANQALATVYEGHAKALGREFIDVDQLPAGGTDMGNISHRVPCLHPLISSAPQDVMIHDPEFTKWSNSELGDQAVLHGAKLLAMTAIDYVCNAKLRADVHKEFLLTKDISDAAVITAWREGQQVRHAGAGCC